MARDSLAGALATGNPQLIAAGQEAFVNGMQTATLVAVGVALVGRADRGRVPAGREAHARAARPFPREWRDGLAAPEADEAILQAALELLAESGYRALTMEKVRERSGVGKATIYRRYGSKEELVAAAIVHLNSDIPLPDDTGSLQGDFAATAQSVLQGAARTGALTLMPRLLSEVVGEPEMHALFYEHLVEPRRRVVRAIVERAKARGEIREEVSTDAGGRPDGRPVHLPADHRRRRRGRVRRPRRAARHRDAGAQSTGVTVTRPPWPTCIVR